ncbi:nucleotide sugar dehydrogenase [Thalassobacillus pellis]|uniref:nucleotide sugar dehydrogenase n=1 Tax=Thalassobacillus pellis TaxID=748008 RepID=UPI001961E7D7|nr:nucleotide sugar dehydrogenase [Thalassobacillus pellis]MBM7551669.1 UDP-N-acetyl-D-mannosaminuronic acid dehydrogenase [Thalassobacillus pellis]
MEKKLCVIGLGYIGLPTAAVFADSGWKVTGIDTNPIVVETLNKGNVHIEENGLEEIVDRVVKNGSLTARMTPVNANVYIIAVPTPHNPDLTANLNYLKSAVRSIIPVIESGNTIIVESTIPPRTMQDVVNPLLIKEGFITGENIHLAHCPERVLPGKILDELVFNNRIVGGLDPISTEVAVDVYRTFVKGNILKTSAENAEMAKLMENTYRDVNIALANELTKISENLNINPLEVISLANEHPRVNIHQPGPGVGGHCLAVDPYFIIEKDPVNSLLISNARKINESMPGFVVEKVKQAIGSNSTVTLFGLAYKGDIDDIRESPALKVYKQLIDCGYSVKPYDPHVKQEQVDFNLYSLEDSLKNSDMVVILTDHSEFKLLDWKQITGLMRNDYVLDTKGCLNKCTLKNYFNYDNLYELKPNTISLTY